MKQEKKRILVVDDEVSITRLLKLNLEGTDQYVVRTENDARAALAAAEEFQPDLILLDVLMPELDGGQLASRLQASPKLEGVPIVFLTAAATKKEIYARGGKVGGLPFLAKPVDLDEVLACLKQHLR
jgi:DNA-binding response OmpR family regulator